jgi:hypothetical protein
MPSHFGNVPVCDESRSLASVRGTETLHDVCFSPDGTAVAFITSSGSQYFVRDAEGSRTAYDFAENLVVGPGGGTISHGARRGIERMLVRNSRPGPAFEWGNAPVIGTEGRAVAYCAIRSAGSYRRGDYARGYFVMIDEHLMGPYEGAAHQAFQPITAELVIVVRHGGRFCRRHREKLGAGVRNGRTAAEPAWKRPNLVPGIALKLVDVHQGSSDYGHESGKRHSGGPVFLSSG